MDVDSAKRGHYRIFRLSRCRAALGSDSSKYPVVAPFGRIHIHWRHHEGLRSRKIKLTLYRNPNNLSFRSAASSREESAVWQPPDSPPTKPV